MSFKLEYYNGITKRDAEPVDVGYPKPNVLKKKAMAMIVHPSDEVVIWSHGFKYRELVGRVYMKNGKFFYRSARNGRVRELTKSGYTTTKKSSKFSLFDAELTM